MFALHLFSRNNFQLQDQFALIPVIVVHILLIIANTTQNSQILAKTNSDKMAKILKPDQIWNKRS